MNLDSLKKSLKAHEGVKASLYKDTEGHTTGGCGHNFDQPLPDKLIELILDFDIQVAIEELDRAFPSWRTHSNARQNVLIELMFNLGAPRLGQFIRFWYALEQKNYSVAAQELLLSRWAIQVGKRAVTLANRFREDSLDEGHPGV